MLKMIEKPACTYVIGTARQIRSLYRRLAEKTAYIPLFADEPRFNPDRVYGIQVEAETGFYHVVSETDVCYLLMGEV